MCLSANYSALMFLVCGMHFQPDYSVLHFRESFSVLHTLIPSSVPFLESQLSKGLPIIMLMVACLCPINFSLAALISSRQSHFLSVSQTFPVQHSSPQFSAIPVFLLFLLCYICNGIVFVLNYFSTVL